MSPEGRRTGGMARLARGRVRVALAVAALSWVLPAPAHAGEGLAGLSTHLGRKPVAADDAKSAPPASSLRWWSIPRPARVAARNLAAAQDAAVTRCVAVEHDDVISYEIHAARRLGLFKKSEFLLTSVSEPKAVAQKRREEQGLRGRLGSLRDAVWPRSSATGGDR